MLGRFVRAGPSQSSLRLGTLTSGPCPASRAPLLSPLLGLSCEACACAVCSWPSSCVSFLPSRVSRSEQVGQLAVQLASLASLEDIDTHGIQSLPHPRSFLRRSLTATSQPRSHALSAAGQFFSASAALPLAWQSSVALLPCLIAPALVRHRCSLPRTSGVCRRHKLIWRLLPAHASRRVCWRSSAISRDKRRRRTRKQAKRSMWRES